MSHERRADAQPFSQGGRASVADGQVLLDGPDGVAVALTAQAALDMGRSLIAAAEQLLGETEPERAD